MGKLRRNKAMYCVVMGDIINSRGLDDKVREEVTRVAKSTFDRINARYRGSFLANFGLVRGDSFEGVLLTQHYAPQIMQDIVKAFYRVKKTLVRISVVMGQLTVTSPDRNEVDGPAFADVMEALVKIKERGSKHWLQVSFDVGTMGRALISSQLGLIMALTERWTDKQREICWTAEEIEGHEVYSRDIIMNQEFFGLEVNKPNNEPTKIKKQELYRLVANKLGSTPAIVKKQLNAASYEAYRQGWEGITSYLIEIDEHTAADKEIIQESYIPYFNMGKRRYNQYNDSEAVLLLEKALLLAINELGDNDLQLISIYTMLADAYIRISEHIKAETMIQSSLTLQESQPKTERYIEVLQIQASLFFHKSDYDKAIIVADEAVSIASDLLNQDNSLWCSLYNILAVSYGGKSDYNSALIYLNKELSFAKQVSTDPIASAVVLINIAVCISRASGSDKAYDSVKLGEALDNANKAYEILVENLPSGHEYIAIAQRFLNEIQEAHKAQKGEPK